MSCRAAARSSGARLPSRPQRRLPLSPASPPRSPTPSGSGEDEDEVDMREEAMEQLCGMVRDSVRNHLYASPIFLADKEAVDTGDPADLYMLPQASSSAATTAACSTTPASSATSSSGSSLPSASHYSVRTRRRKGLCVCWNFIQEHETETFYP